MVRHKTGTCPLEIEDSACALSCRSGVLWASEDVRLATGKLADLLLLFDRVTARVIGSVRYFW